MCNVRGGSIVRGTEVLWGPKELKKGNMMRAGNDTLQRRGKRDRWESDHEDRVCPAKDFSFMLVTK